MIVLRMAGLFVLSVVLLLATAWVCGALWYQLPVSRGWRIAALVASALLGLATLVLCWRHQGMRALPAYAVAFTVVLGWWAGIQPTGQRDWADDVARQTRATVQDRFITFDQVRDFEWRSETDYTVRWKTARYDLDTVETVDVATSYWMGPAIAHTLVSFGFRDGRYLTFSIEIRKRRGEAFSSIAGFFKHFEATLVAAEESDILRTRTHARGEDVICTGSACRPKPGARCCWPMQTKPICWQPSPGSTTRSRPIAPPSCIRWPSASCPACPCLLYTSPSPRD